MLEPPRLRNGFIATGIALLVGLAIPFVYGQFAEGPELARQAILSSPDVQRECGTPTGLFLVPWHLSVNDSTTQGELSLRYSFSCNGKRAWLDAEYIHHGHGWIAQELEVHIGEHTYSLVKKVS